MLTQMYVGGVMACTHDHAPPRKPISPMFPSTVHKCTCANRLGNTPFFKIRLNMNSLSMTEVGYALEPRRLT